MGSTTHSSRTRIIWSKESSAPSDTQTCRKPRLAFIAEATVCSKLGGPRRPVDYRPGWRAARGRTICCSLFQLLQAEHCQLEMIDTIFDRARVADGTVVSIAVAG